MIVQSIFHNISKITDDKKGYQNGQLIQWPSRDLKKYAYMKDLRCHQRRLKTGTSNREKNAAKGYRFTKRYSNDMVSIRMEHGSQSEIMVYIH